jgi:hypothetical protein
LMRLAEDRVDDARAEAEAAQKIWRKPHFNLQHRAALCAWLDIDLYDGRAGDARRRLKGEWRALRGTLALFQNGRIEAESYRARIGLALMADGEARIRRDVMNAIRRLEKEDAAYATALALLFRAALRYDVGDTDDAVGLLNRGEQACLACDMRLFAAAARYRRGRIVGGDQGDELVRSAVSTMSAEGIVKPERIAALLVPGSWTAA